LYIIIQYIFWHLFTIYLPSLLSIGFFHPSSVGYTDVDRLTQYYNNFYYRPASFFGEPAFYSYYSLVGLIVSLFKTKTDIKINRIIPIFLSIGIILSTSTAGIYLMFLVWCYYVYKRLYSKKLVIRLLKTVLFALPIVLLLVLLFPWISTSLEGSNYFSKIEVILSKPFDFVNSSRLGKSYSLFSLLDGFQRIVGVGFGNEDIYLQLDCVYYNRVKVLLLCTGYIGLIIFLISSLKLLQKKNPISFILAVIYILLCFTSSMLYSSFSIVYLTIIFYIDSNSFIYKMTNSYNKE